MLTHRTAPEQEAQPTLSLGPGGGAHVLCQPFNLPPPTLRHPAAAEPKGQREELNMTSTWGGGCYLSRCQSPKERKGNDRSMDLHKVHLGFCRETEVIRSNSLVSTPCQGCSNLSSTPCQCQVGSGRKWEPSGLAFPAPSSGWTGLLVTSLPPNQLVLSGSTFYLNAELCPFCQGGSSWLQRHPCYTLSSGGALGDAAGALLAVCTLAPPPRSPGTGGSAQQLAFCQLPHPAADPNWDRSEKPKHRQKRPACLLSQNWS